MILFKHNAIIQSQAMIHPTATLNSIFLCQSQAAQNRHDLLANLSMSEQVSSIVARALDAIAIIQLPLNLNITVKQ
jgi:hypothetical protein